MKAPFSGAAMLERELPRTTSKELAGFLAEKDICVYILRNSGGSQGPLPCLVTQALGFEHRPECN